MLSCSKTKEEKICEFTLDFIKESNKNLLSSLTSYYPNIIKSDSIAYIPEIKTEDISMHENEPGQYVIFISPDIVFFITEEDDKFIITDSKGYFLFPEARLDFARKTGMKEEGVFDVELADRFNDKEFLEYIANKIDKVPSEILTLGERNGNQIKVVNNTDQIIQESYYKVLVEVSGEYANENNENLADNDNNAFSNYSEVSDDYSEFNPTVIEEAGRHIDPYSSVLYFDGGSVNGDHLVKDIKVTIPKEELLKNFLPYINWRGNEYQNYKKLKARGTNTASRGEINGYEYVDLDLPSGIVWATCNVGATSPYESGGFYAWGETNTKDTYKRENSFHWGRGITIEGHAQYDIVKSLWGGNWRMPSENDYRELINECVWTWISENGVCGYKIEGLNSNSIFLPAGGFREDSEINEANSFGRYWTSTYFESQEKDKTSGIDLSFSQYNIEIEEAFKYLGFNIRPVSMSPGPKMDLKTSLTPTGKKNGHDYVDLGLPSGTKWASVNVGASTSYESGIYSTWNNANPGDQWGQEWKLPSDNQIRELIDNCQWTWKKVKNVDGYLVTGPNGKSIYLPAAGFEINGKLNGLNKDGYYFSDNIDKNSPNIQCMGLSFNNGTYIITSLSQDNYKYLMRAVLR